ncbi:formylglycine-generating enzyme family protein [Glaciihabitans sp. dw_435]|uniref:formylglycine-generating enzyme family protein n=1 Tax=Glaciihabitans sp. dw_435 TaxID=2720081 RepID=UPI002101E403|nr:formylglycine-generating enzyme family protein [Glaciihabitans sp. dw_435]
MDNAQTTVSAPAITAMRRIDGGTFAMGSEQFYADEGPVHEVAVDPFEMDVHPVTTEQFAEFVARTGYVTTAERSLPADDFPDLTPQERSAGALVFQQTPGPVPLSEWRQWWRWVTGADWRHPFGPLDAEGNGTTPDRSRHPVVQVSFEDASRYAGWAGKRLPTEAEWEFAARGGLDGRTYAWGDELHPGGTLMANTWQGRFPFLNEGADGWRGTSPVGWFPPNGYGLSDMIGNVWEWTVTPYATRHAVEACCVGSVDPDADGRRVLKGGSHLCAPEYCLRYRPAARSPQSDDTSTTHIGFRCARSL